MREPRFGKSIDGSFATAQWSIATPRRLLSACRNRTSYGFSPDHTAPPVSTCEMGGTAAARFRERPATTSLREPNPRGGTSSSFIQTGWPDNSSNNWLKMLAFALDGCLSVRFASFTRKPSEALAPLLQP